MDILLTISSFKRLLYLVLVISGAFLIKNSITTTESYWVCWSALVISFITQGDTFKRRVIVMVITGFITAFVACIVGVVAYVMPFYIILIAIITSISMYIGIRYPRYFLAVFIINLFAILSGSITTTLMGQMERFFCIIMGLGIAVVLQILFYPYFIRNEIRSLMIVVLGHLREFNNQIFTCFLEPEYADNVYLYERRLHECKIQYMCAMARLREDMRLAATAMDENERISNEKIIESIELLHGNMLDYSQLRRRITDFTSFSVCEAELTAIAAEIDKAISGAILHLTGKHYYQNAEMLSKQIKRLDDNYQNVLQVAAREPLVFLLFIDSLNAFCRSIQLFYEAAIPSSSGYS